MHAWRAVGDRRAATWQNDTNAVHVSFDIQPGAGRLVFDREAGCPSVVLNVYCRREQLAGFEVKLASGGWHAPRAAVASGNDSVLLTANGGAKPMRVRYAYSDWPVVSLRNSNGGGGVNGADGNLPARLFDIAVH